MPKDLLIFLPEPSTTKPCVRTASYGGTERVPMEARSEEWNHPLCWSLPSR